MSKCWYCNNELTTGENPKHFGICNKCYDEMFKSRDTIISSFTNKISDLEAKLVEMEKKYAELFCRNIELETLYSQKTALLNFYKDTDLVKENQQLKQQLHDLPTKIVGEIKEQLFNHFNVKNIEEYEKLPLIDSLFTAETMVEILDTILKKYEGENKKLIEYNVLKKIHLNPYIFTAKYERWSIRKIEGKHKYLILVEEEGQLKPAGSYSTKSKRLLMYNVKYTPPLNILEKIVISCKLFEGM